MFVYYKIYREPVEIRKKTAVPGVEVVHEKATSIHPFYFIF